jgi:prepilin-type N-terminal cleavage/methylation domain-containing protein
MVVERIPSFNRRLQRIPHRAQQSRLRGFTLIELVITVIVLGLISVAVVPVVTNTMRADVIYTNKAAAKDALRYAAERLALEISAMGYDKTTGFDIQARSGNSVTFQRPTATLQSGGLEFPSVPVKICYHDAAVRLTYEETSSSDCSGEVLIDRLGSELNGAGQEPSFEFTWRNAEGGEIPSSSTLANFKTALRKVDISISVRIDPDGANLSFETIKRSVDLTSRTWGL